MAAPLGLAVTQAHAYPYPPDWDGPDWGAGQVIEGISPSTEDPAHGGPIHFAPAPWPSEPEDPANCGVDCGDWKPYSRFQADINDPRVQDPSNGGTSPQNYVNIASSCIDKNLPSIYYHLRKGAAVDGSEDVIMFRWRVEQIANTYATGPKAGSYGATDPWNSALWTVLFDLDGDGFRDVAAHLDGSSGAPSTAIDRLAGIWGNVPTQSVDYLNDPSINLIAHNPTAFIGDNNQILNFAGNPANPTEAWPNGSDETLWDYGTSRSRLVYTNSCTEYFIDYQIPVRMLDASSTGPNPDLNGPRIDRDTPISMLFCTANSLNNPFQKDCALNASFIGDASRPAPFGDYLSFNKPTPYAQPIVSSVSATPPSTCPGNYTLAAKIQDTLYVNASGSVEPSIQSVEFYYWYDQDGDGTTAGDPGSAWTYAVDGTLQSGTLNTWAASWDASGLLKGRYLIGVQAVDDGTLHDLDVPDAPVNHRTFSYLPGSTDPATQAQIYTNDWGWDGLAKIWVQGTDIGWIEGEEGAFPDHDPTITPGGTEDWFGNPDVTGVQTALIGVALNVCGLSPELIKSANVEQTTIGADVQYSLSVVNKTGGSLTVDSITDTLPDGFSYVSTQGPGDTPASSLCSDSCPTPTTGGGNSYTWSFSTPATVPGGCSSSDYSACTRTLVYNTRASATVGTYNNVASMLTDFGSVASNPVQVGVGAPRLSLSKTPTDGADPPNPKYSAALGETITYVITYSNDSPVTATGVVLTDVIPDGLTYGSCTGGCTRSGDTLDTLIWQIGDLAPGEGPYTVSYTATVTDPYPATAQVPNVNTVTIDGDNTEPAEASASVFVQTPRPQLVIQKTANKTLVDPAGTSPANQVTFTLSYANTGDAATTGVVLSDPIPAGFTFVSCSGSCAHPGVGNNGTVSWNLGTLNAGASGSVTLTAQVSNPFTGTDNPVTNTASLSSTEITTPVTDSADVGVSQSQTEQLCRTLYLSDQQGDVGNDGTQYLATTATPTGETKTIAKLADDTLNTGIIEIARFYQDPVSSQLVTFDGSSTLGGQLDYIKSASLGGSAQSNSTLYVTVYDYDPADGSTTQIAQSVKTDNGAPTPPVTLTGASATGSLAKGHRLLVVMGVDMASNKATTIELHANSVNSYVEICAPPPANLVLDKTVDTASLDATGASRTLTYTLNYANTSGATGTTGAILTDTLPLSGVTYSSCDWSGSHFTGCSYSGGVVSFHDGSGSGVSIPAGASGSVTVTVNVADSLSVSSLTNTASISSDQTSAVEATAVTAVVGGEDPEGTANLIIAKSASDTLLLPGDTVTYTLTLLNAGTRTATNITISDDFPEADWFAYQAGSCTVSAGTCSPSGTPSASLSWALDSLAPGTTATLSFTMDVGTSETTSPPDGVTTRDNLATGAYAGCESESCGSTSNTVTVSVSTNPYLAIDKSVSPTDADPPPAPGDVLTYTLLVNNTGSGGASNVQVRDPIPAYTSFIAGSITVPQGWSSSFDAINNQVLFEVGTLHAEKSASLSFQVRLNSPLPAGDSTLTNIAAVTASNAPSKTDDAVTTAQAAPVLTLDKSGPASAPYPAARLTAAASASTTLFVDDIAAFTVGQFIQVGATLARITGLAGSALIVDTAITAAANADVIGAVTYSLTYRNTGDADASGVTITDTLPAGPPGLTYVASVPEADSAPAIGASGVVTWNLGALPAEASGSVQVIALPTGPGTVTNSAAIDSAETDPVEDEAQTAFGGLRITKRTTTPIAAAPGEATYVIEVTNTLDTAVAGVTVTDTLSSGFSYKSTDDIVATGATRTSTEDPAAGAQQPVWGTWTLPANGSLSLTFTANVGDSALSAEEQPVGPGTYQNEASVATTTPGVGITPFDPLATTAEDVTILPADTGLLEGVVYQDNDADGQFDAATDTPLGGISVTIIAADGTVYVAITDSAGYYSRIVAAGDTLVDVQNGTVLPELVLTTSTGDDGTDPATVTVPTGGIATKNTGYVPAGADLASIAGNVWNDADADQAVNGAEAGMIGVQVILRDGDGAIVATEYTDALGNYAFPNIPPGSYQVDLVPPTGYLVTTGNDPAPVTVAAGSTGEANFGLLRGVTLSGTVFNDLDASKVQDGTEAGVDPDDLNVVITDSAGKVLAVSAVAADGTWSADVTPGSGYQAYVTTASPTLGETVTPAARLPAGWLVTGENIADTVQAPANGILTGIDASADRSGLNFGIRAGGSIGDYVWHDTNHDGIQDPAESGIAGVKVILYDSTGTNKLVETLTDGAGKYRFTDLADGTYVVQFQPAAAYTRTTTNAGSGALQDSFDSDAANGEYKVTVTLTGGTTNLTIDAGFYIEDASPASIGDRVWYDSNGDGIQDAGEPGLGGVSVSLLDADNSNALVATRVSDADGSYEFAGLPAGNYVLQFDAPDGYVLSPQDAGSPNDDATDSDADPSTGLTASIPLTAGQALTDVDAGLSLTSGDPGRIGDRVWYDGGSGTPANDGNGVQDAGEPGIPGVWVNLYDATGTTLLQTTQTDTTGAYQFNGLAAGDYVVEVVKPNASYDFSPTGEGTSETDSDPNPTTGRVTLTLADGEVVDDIDAGLRVPDKEPITIGDFVWKDLDGQKDPDSGEGLASVEVVLYDNLGFPLARLTTTAADANYGFTGVAAGGSYRVAIDTGTLGNLIQIADPDVTLDNRTDLIKQDQSTDAADFGYLAPSASVTIVKTAADGEPRNDSQQLRSGGTANFEVTVTNSGNLTLTSIAVTDALTPACDFTIASLAPGASSDVKTCAKANVTANFTNTANVEAQPVDASGDAFGDTVTDSDTTAVVVIAPAITIVKTPDSQTVTSGGTASFTIRVTNTGDVTLTDVQISDDSTSACAKTSTDIAGLGSLVSAAYVEYTCESSALTASFVNTASVSATPPVGAAVTDDDSAAVNVVTSGISISKTPEEQTIHKGGTAEFTITVTNTGDVDLTNVSVADPNSSDCAKTIGTLAASDEYEYTCSLTGVDASFDNTATVTADGGLSADDVAKVTVIDPQLSLTKLTNDANDDEGPITVRTGTLVTWEYIVENTGDVALTNVTVEDAPEGTISCPPDQAAELAVGASMTCLGYGLAGETSYSNTATVTGTPPSGPDVEATDASAYTGYNPGVIGNRIWLDENGNSIPDAGESGIANLKVELKDDGTLVATTYTDTNGGYLFTGVPAGDYQVVVTPTLSLLPTYNEDFAAEPSAGALDNQTAVTLAAGVQHLTADFGYNWVAPLDSTSPGATTTGAIGDRVWSDANGDGLQNPGESGIGGVTLTLTGPGADGILGTADDTSLATTQTDAAGNYIFDDLPSGAYAITVDTTTLPTASGLSWTQTGDPDGAGATDGKTTTPILLAPGDVYVNADFGFQPNQGSSIGDLVWFDMNADGQLDAGETGVPGIGIALVQDTNGNDVWDAGEPVIATTVTDASGNYLFPGVQAGDYVVAVTDAESLLYWALPSSDPDLPGELNNGLDPDSRFDQQAAVSVDGTSDQLAMDFGYMAYGMHSYSDIPGLIGSSGLIGDLVFLDRNGNGEADPGEGLQGVRVELFEPSDLDNPVAWTTTNAEGAYAFGHVNVQATWVVQIDRATLPNGGAGLTNSIDPDGGTADQSEVSNISETGNLNLLQDFGYAADSPATIGGTVFDDVDADGELNADDAEGMLLANVTIELRDAAGNRAASTRTDSQGHYSFTGLPAGTYSVHVTDTRNLLEGWWHSLGDQAADADNESKSDPFTLEVTAGQTNTNIDFGYYRQGAALGNRVWSDTNGDGIQDSDEAGLAGVTVQLVVTYPNGGSTALKTLSGSDGGYVFGNLLLDESFNGAGAGQPSYSISAVASDGYTASPVEQGDDRLVDSNDPTGTTATVLKGQLTTAVTDDPGSEPSNAGYDFGYEPQIDLSLTKEVSPTTQTVGEEVTFTLTLSNAVGFSDATGVEVTDLLPSGYTFVSADPSADYASASGLWTVGNLAADDSATLTITARVNASGTYENVAEVTAADQSDDDSTPGNSATEPSEDDTASAGPTISPQIDLSLTKTVSAMSPKVGDTVTFTLTLNNAVGYSNATGVSVQDVVPAGYGSISDISDSGSASGNTVTWTGLTVNANSNKSLTFKAVVLPSGPYANTAEVTAADQDDKDSTPDNGTSNEEDDTDSVTPTPDAQIDLSLTKSVDPESPKVGDAVTFTLTLSNAAGYADATDVSVQDALPAGYGTVSEISDSGSLSGSTLTWSGLSLAAGSSKDLTFKAVVKNTGPYTNVAEVTAAGQPDKDSTPNNGATTPAEDDRATLTPTIGAQIDLSLTKTVAPQTPKVGDTVTFTLTAANAAGFTDATGVAVTDLLPSGYRFVSADPAADYASATGLWAIGDLDAGASAILEIEARVLASGEYENIAEVTDADQEYDKDSTPGNGETEPAEDDYAAAEPTVTASADLIVEKNGPVLVAAEGGITYTVTVSNAGPSAANDAVFADDPASGGLIGPITWTCGNAVGGAVCPSDSGSGALNATNATIASFPAGGSLTYTITGTAPATGTVTNIATVTAPVGVTDPDLDNNSDQVLTGLGDTPATADLSVLKYGPAQVVTGGALTYHIVVTNAGYAAANGAVFTDTVPAEVTGVTWTCTAVGGALCPDDIMREGNAIAETIASFPAGGSLIYTVTGTAPATGTVQNTASIEAPAEVTDPDDTNNQSSADTLVVTGPLESADLALAKTGPATVAGGGLVTYQLVVSNGGAAAADDAGVTDLVPSVLSDVTWTCGSATGGAVCPTLNGALDPGVLNSGKGEVNLTIPTFPAGSGLTISVTGTAPAAGAFVNSAQVLPPAGVADPDPSNNPGGPVITQIPTVTLSGVVFNDCPTCGGIPEDGIQNGDEPGVDPGNLNVVILDADGKVLAVAPVADATGAWSATVPAGTGYQAYITTATPGAGSKPDSVVASLPSGWVITGENDGTDNGILIDINASITTASPTVRATANTSVTGLDFGIEASNPGVQLVKTAFLTDEAGASCTTSESPLVYVNKNQDPVNVTWCFTISNTGNEALNSLRLVDAPLGITLADVTPEAGFLPLAPGASLVYRYDETGRTSSLENTATVSMTPVGGGGPVSDTDDAAIFAYIFDPPYGVKTGQVNGVDVIRWNMVWINNSPIVANGVVIEDPILGDVTYVAGSLTCTPRGTTTVVGTCDDSNYNDVTRLITVEANFGPDLGATTEGEADNELVISFEVMVDNPTISQTFENQAEAQWDCDGACTQDPLIGVTDDDEPGGPDPTPIEFDPPAPIPTLSEWAMLLLTLMLLSIGWRRLQGTRPRP
ncbi:IPTL-CTERM sorting domain-containing protein [Thiohalocapsa marina]|uniref:IPTL-CTERM sorting domain-containing protein n=1 Tax=Thiohalocapsa marina TaxID=424902 RepID=UPI00147841D2|nr:IPTL-CTERM sorting domain-containing protein [Thiohalocapsa marina]